MTQAFKPPSIKQLKNEKALKMYAFILCVLIVIAVASRWLRAVNDKSGGETGRRVLHLAFRKLERRTTWACIGRPSLELVVVVGIYLAINGILSSNVLAIYQVNHFASRFGWLGAANMAFCVFLGLKNTPLSLLAVVSHAQLNILHRLVGYTAVLLVALHALFYTIHFGRLGRWETLIEPKNLWGIGAGLSMLILLMGIFRHMHYKLFYISHIAGFLFAAVMTGLHRPDWAKKLPVVMLFTLLLWILDRSIRTLRMSYNLVNNQVKLFPLPDGGTRLLLKKPCIKTAKPGSHCFLWIPRLRFYQAHPFTIVSNTSSGLELVIKSHKGFTRAVSEFAIRQPGRGAWVSVDGPYGSLPDTSKYDKIILISGGSGAAFTFGLMNHILDHSEGVSLQSTDFIWAVKRTEHLSWFHRHLRRYRKSGSQTRTTLYITDEDPATTSLKSIVSESSDCDEDLLETDDLLVPTNEIAELVDNVEYKKLDTDMAIQGAIRKVASHERVLVATCGPKSLMNAVRDSVDRCRMDSNNRIDVHCEDFSG